MEQSTGSRIYIDDIRIWLDILLKKEDRCGVECSCGQYLAARFLLKAPLQCRIQHVSPREVGVQLKRPFEVAFRALPVPTSGKELFATEAPADRWLDRDVLSMRFTSRFTDVKMRFR